MYIRTSYTYIFVHTKKLRVCAMEVPEWKKGIEKKNGTRMEMVEIVDYKGWPFWVSVEYRIPCFIAEQMALPKSTCMHSSVGGSGQGCAGKLQCSRCRKSISLCTCSIWGKQCNPNQQTLGHQMGHPLSHQGWTDTRPPNGPSTQPPGWTDTRPPTGPSSSLFLGSPRPYSFLQYLYFFYLRICKHCIMSPIMEKYATADRIEMILIIILAVI